ncbi:hypothetical protein ACQ4LE_008523 [Meloidogyne hapla]|uniref:Uncharacterized protein n=1 Tax=Meloidogyne hapla TaxID=6305 RepID=A0A1I8B4F4_MELHA
MPLILVVGASIIFQFLPFFLLVPGVLTCCKRKKRNNHSNSTHSSISTTEHPNGSDSTPIEKAVSKGINVDNKNHLNGKNHSTSKKPGEVNKKDGKQKKIKEVKNKPKKKVKEPTPPSVKLTANKPLIQQRVIALSSSGSRTTPVSSSSSSGSKSNKSVKLSLIKLKEQRREKFASIMEEDEDFEVSKDAKPHCLVSAASHLESQQSQPSLWRAVHHESYRAMQS